MQQWEVFISKVEQSIELVDKVQQRLLDHYWQNFYTNATSHDYAIVLQGGAVIGLFLDAMELARYIRTKKLLGGFMTPVWLVANLVNLFNAYRATNSVQPSTLDQLDDICSAHKLESLWLMKNKLNIDWDISIADFKQILCEIKNAARNAPIFLQGCQNPACGATLLLNFFQRGGRDVFANHILPLLDVDQIVGQYRPLSQINSQSI